MKILIYGSRMDLISGHSRPAYELASHLLQQGHQVRILSTPLNEQRLNRHRKKQMEESFLELPPTERILKSNRDLLFPNPALRSMLAEHIEWADVFHGFSFWSSLLLLRAFEYPLPSVLTLNTLPFASISDFRSIRGLSLRALLRPAPLLALLMPRFSVVRSLGRVERLISWTEYLKGEFMNRGVPADRITTIPIGVDQRRFSQRESSSSVPPQILYFGLMSPARGPELALRAFAELRKNIPSAKLIIADREHHQRVDQGFLEQQRSHISELIKIMSLHSNVELQGYSSDILALINSTDLVVLPFKSPYGYSHPPLTVLEALAMGKPVVSTNIGSVPELLDRADMGIIARSTDPRSLAHAMERALELDREDLAQSRVARVRDSFSWQEAAKKILHEYHLAVSFFP